MRRPLTLLLALLALAPLTACGDDDAGGGGGGGEAGVRTTPVQFGDGDEVWLRVSTGGGFVPYIANLREVPQLLLFDDGRLVRLVEDEDDPAPPVPQFEAVQLDETAAADLLDTFAAVVDGPDPGDAPVTDLSTTTIEVTTDGRTRDLGIYALGFEDGLTGEQVEARRAAQTAIDDAFALEGAEPYLPDEWLVLTSTVPTGSAPTDIVAWPLEPDRRATAAEPKVCTRVSGEDRDAVLDALDGTEYGVLVGEGEDGAEIAMRPVLTGDETCNLSDSDEFVER